MLKIKKGLKKKVKGKKDKGKEDDLFDPEQLAKYKKELEEQRAKNQGGESEGTQHSPEAEGDGDHEKDEEWLKFKALTGGVDDILKKATGDLDRIKEDSYYQKQAQAAAAKAAAEASAASESRKVASVAPSSEATAPAPAPAHSSEKNWVVNFDDVSGEWDEESEHALEQAEVEEEQQPEEEEEPEEPETAQGVNIIEIPEINCEIEDSLFDTSFLDAIESGEIQLAYIPESPPEPEDDDPFDTSGVADVVKRIEEEEKKKAKQIDLGSVVHVLSTGNKGSEKLGGTSKEKVGGKNTSAKVRPRPKAVNLLGDFEDVAGVIAPVQVKDTGNNIADQEPAKDVFDIIEADLSDDILPAIPLEELSVSVKEEVSVDKDKNKDVTPDWKDVIGEFDTILNKSEGIKEDLEVGAEPDDFEDEFSKLAEESLQKQQKQEEIEHEPDPFDTSFAVEVTRTEIDATNCTLLKDEDDFDPRAGEIIVIPSPVKNKAFTEQFEVHTEVVKEAPILPVSADSVPKGDSTAAAEPEDPFDTSHLTQVAPPGKHELKLLEQELESVPKAPPRPPVPVLPLTNRSIPPQTLSEDDDFNPRADESAHILDHPPEIQGSKVLSPCAGPLANEPDPFDTSIASSVILAPGKAQLKALEEELIVKPEAPAPQPAVAQEKFDKFIENFEEDFDPRKHEEPATAILVSPQVLGLDEILEAKEDFVCEKPLTPLAESNAVPEPDFEDPFDTSNVSVVDPTVPNKRDIKQLEGELLSSLEDVKPANPIVIPKPPSESELQAQAQNIPKKPKSPEKPKTVNILEADEPLPESGDFKPLSPVVGENIGTVTEESPSQKGPDLKKLEEELGVQAGLPRTLSDPDFDPREPVHPSTHLQNHPLTPVPASTAPGPEKQAVEETKDPFNTSEIADPFDTSAVDVLPGRTEIKLLEAELL